MSQLQEELDYYSMLEDQKIEKQFLADDLLKNCLYALNIIPNKKLGNKDYKDTYALASAIDKYFKK